MGLGQFILKGIRKSPSSTRTSKKRPKRKTRARPKKEKTLPVEQEPAEPIKGFLLKEFVRQLSRKGSPLKSSLEGFILDQRSEHTQRAYGKDIKRFIRFLLLRDYQREQSGQKEEEALSPTVFIAYKDFLLSENLEETTVDRHLATLKSFFKWLVDDGHLDRNPAERVRFLKPKRLSKTSGFTDEEVRKVLLLPNLHRRTGAQHYAILMILFYCGLRRSEICGLTFSQLGFERGKRVLRLLGKGNSERLVVLPRATWNALLHYFYINRLDFESEPPERPLFAPIRNNRGGNLKKPLDPSMIFYIVKHYAKKAGIDRKVSPHSCRATAISNARDHHVPDRAIQEFAGWSSPNMITRYDKRKTAVEDSASLSISYGERERTPPRYEEEP